jgi:hypothetical protein
MTSTMERGKVVGLSDEVIAKMRQRFGDECKQLLEDMAQHANCTCGRAGSAGSEHHIDCPVAVFREAAHTVWLWGQP